MSRNDCCVSWNDDHTQTCPTRVIPALQAQLAEARKELELLRRVAEAMRVFADEDTYTDGTKVYNGDWSANMKDYARDALREWEAGRMS